MILSVLWDDKLLVCTFENQLLLLCVRSPRACLPMVDETLGYSGRTAQPRRTQTVAVRGSTYQLVEVVNVTGRMCFMIKMLQLTP